MAHVGALRIAHIYEELFCSVSLDRNLAARQFEFWKYT